MALLPEDQPGIINPEVGPTGQIMPAFAPPVQGNAPANHLMPGFYQHPQQDIPLPHTGPHFSFAPAIDGQISNQLLQTNPFPEELVPPFRVRPGDSGGALSAGNAGYTPANVNLNQFDPVTREVQEEELTSFQLEQLLSGDSAYMQDARRRGLEFAGSRGALNSSVAAGASQRAAIQAGAPIAQADAQAYIRAASENLAAVNNNILAKMNASVAMATTNAQVSGSLAGARLANDSRERIAETQLNAQYVMQQAQFVQQQFLQQMDIEGRSRLMGEEFGFNRTLQRDQFGFNTALQDDRFAHDIFIEETFGQPRFEAQMLFNQSSLQAQTYTNLMANYAQGIASMNGIEMDDAARQRGQQFWEDYLQSGLSYISNLSNTSNWPDFDFDFGP